MNPIPQSQFDPSKFPEFALNRVFQCANIVDLEKDIEATKRGLIEETAWRNKQGKPEDAKDITFGPVAVGEQTAVTDHVDVFQYYSLVPKKD